MTGIATILICDRMPTASRLIDGSARAVLRPALGSDLIRGILDRTGLNILIHRARRSASSSIAFGLAAGSAARLQSIEAMPLAAILPRADLLVSFASPALVKGCRAGFRPVQIGPALIGSEEFTHIFPDCSSFIDALANGALEGRLSLYGYRRFEEFVARTLGRSRGYRSDPILHELRRTRSARASLLRTFAGAVANPAAAMRLVVRGKLSLHRQTSADDRSLRSQKSGR